MNETVNARPASDPALRLRVSVQPQPSCLTGERVGGQSGGSESRAGETPPEPRVTTADVLEALHRATGMAIVSDYYTRVYPVTAGTLRSRPLFEALNQSADALRLRWTKAGEWLQFRSTSFFNDRLKEVPNPLLTRWAATRWKHGLLTIDDLCEIVQLPDVRLHPQCPQQP